MSSMAIASCQPQHRRQLCIQLVFSNSLCTFSSLFIQSVHVLSYTHETQPWQSSEFFTFCFCEYIKVFGNADENFCSSKSPDLDLVSMGDSRSGESTQWKICWLRLKFAMAVPSTQHWNPRKRIPRFSRSNSQPPHYIHFECVRLCVAVQWTWTKRGKLKIILANAFDMRERIFHKQNTCMRQQMMFRRNRCFFSHRIRSLCVAYHYNRCKAEIVPLRWVYALLCMFVHTPKTKRKQCWKVHTQVAAHTFPHKIIIVIIAMAKLALLILFTFCVQHGITSSPEYVDK